MSMEHVEPDSVQEEGTWSKTLPGRFTLDAYREQRGEELPNSQEDMMSEEQADTTSPTLVDESAPALVQKDGEPEPLEDHEIMSSSAEDLAAVRELILTLHPAIVPELIGGDSVAALIASVIPAQEAYNRIVANVHIPAGGNPVVGIDVDALSTYEKIRRGLKSQASRVP